MWMGELSERSGVPVATIKYYLRQGLVPPGEAASATRARYDEGHVVRLRLIRALVDVAGMSLEQVRRVLDVVDDDTQPLDVAIGQAHTELSPELESDPSEESTARVAALVRSRRWRVEPDGRHARALAAALDAMEAAGQPMADESLGVYAAAAHDVAEVDLGSMVDRSRAGATAYAVVGTLLSEPVLVSLRRMAQENLARRRLARTGRLA